MKHELSEAFVYSVKEWLFNFPPRECSTHLRNMLLQYIGYCQEDGLPPDFNETITHLQALFSLLDLAEEEVKDWEEAEAEADPEEEEKAE